MLWISILLTTCQCSLCKNNSVKTIQSFHYFCKLIIILTQLIDKNVICALFTRICWSDIDICRYKVLWSESTKTYNWNYTAYFYPILKWLFPVFVFNFCIVTIEKRAFMTYNTIMKKSCSYFEEKPVMFFDNLMSI